MTQPDRFDHYDSIGECRSCHFGPAELYDGQCLGCASLAEAASPAALDHRPVKRIRNRQAEDRCIVDGEFWPCRESQRAASPAALDVERLTRVLTAIHGDNVPFPRGVPTPPREYAEMIAEVDARLIDQEDRP